MDKRNSDTFSQLRMRTKSLLSLSSLDIDDLIGKKHSDVVMSISNCLNTVVMFVLKK